eukprot:10935782-Alexandrium_andersonii.AAC.1
MRSLGSDLCVARRPKRNPQPAQGSSVLQSAVIRNAPRRACRLASIRAPMGPPLSRHPSGAR